MKFRTSLATTVGADAQCGAPVLEEPAVLVHTFAQNNHKRRIYHITIKTTHVLDMQFRTSLPTIVDSDAQRVTLIIGGTEKAQTLAERVV